jgi:hypothetical protein
MAEILDENLPPLYFFEKSLKESEESMNFNDEEYVNKIGITNRDFVSAGIGAAVGIGGSLLISDLVNKDKQKKQQQQFNQQLSQQKTQSEASLAAQNKLLLAEQERTKQFEMQISELAKRNQESTGQNKTLLYAGIGVGAIIVIGLIVGIVKK